MLNQPCYPGPLRNIIFWVRNVKANSIHWCFLDSFHMAMYILICLIFCPLQSLPLSPELFHLSLLSSILICFIDTPLSIHKYDFCSTTQCSNGLMGKLFSFHSFPKLFFYLLLNFLIQLLHTTSVPGVFICLESNNSNQWHHITRSLPFVCESGWAGGKQILSFLESLNFWAKKIFRYHLVQSFHFNKEQTSPESHSNKGNQIRRQDHRLQAMPPCPGVPEQVCWNQVGLAFCKVWRVFLFVLLSLLLFCFVVSPLKTWPKKHYPVWLFSMECEEVEGDYGLNCSVISSVLKDFAGQRKETYIEIRFLNVIPKLFKLHDLILCRGKGRRAQKKRTFTSLPRKAFFCLLVSQLISEFRQWNAIWENLLSHLTLSFT